LVLTYVVSEFVILLRNLFVMNNSSKEFIGDSSEVIFGKV
jgi:hypothetical protein